MNIDKRPHPGGRRSIRVYRRISARRARPSRSPSLGEVILWVGVGIAALVAFDRSRQAPAPAAPPAVLTAAEEIVPEPAEPPPTPTDAPMPPERADSMRLREAGAPLSTEAPAADEPAKPDTTVRVALQRDRGGNYVGMGTINGKSARLLVDTGASVVIVPEPLANRLGLKKGRPMTFRTGGGTVTHYATELDTLSIGAIQISHVPAAINPQMQEDFALLGMSALGLLRFSQEGNDLVLSYDSGTNAEPQTGAPAPVRFRRSVKECMGESRVIDQGTLNCLNRD